MDQVVNRFRSICAIWDASTGLYHMGERYYDPPAGRFIQEDPLGERYGYADDNPVNLSDPSGLMFTPTRAGCCGRHCYHRRARQREHGMKVDYGEFRKYIEDLKAGTRGFGKDANVVIDETGRVFVEAGKDAAALGGEALEQLGEASIFFEE